MLIFMWFALSLVLKMAGFLRVVGEDPHNIFSLELHNPYRDM